MDIKDNAEFIQLKEDYGNGLFPETEFIQQRIRIKTKLYEAANSKPAPLDILDSEERAFLEKEMKAMEGSQNESQTQAWGQFAENNYEVSSAGDKRFSAFHARFKEGVFKGMSVEEVYQGHIKGYKNTPEWAEKGPMAGKGKPPRVAIKMLEDKSEGYVNRTKVNAKSADATIAIAIDFTTAGEELTKNSVRTAQKKFIAIDASNLNVTNERVNKMVELLNSVNAKKLNIAGNGIYTMRGVLTQKQCDDFTYKLLKEVLSRPNLKNKIQEIRSGGQTGFDEAGVKAAQRLGISAVVLAPNGFKFRGADGKDVVNEDAFRGRFAKSKQQMFSEYQDLWNDWAKQNPELIAELKEKAKGKVLTDKFATTEISQARALANIINEGVNEVIQENLFEKKPEVKQPTLEVKDQTIFTEKHPIVKRLQAKMDHAVVYSALEEKTVVIHHDALKEKRNMRKSAVFSGTKADCELWNRVTEQERGIIAQLSDDVNKLRHSDTQDKSIRNRVEETLKKFGEVRMIGNEPIGDSAKVEEIKKRLSR